MSDTNDVGPWRSSMLLQLVVFGRVRDRDVSPEGAWLAPEIKYGSEADVALAFVGKGGWGGRISSNSK